MDARHPNSNNDQSSESWPMEPLATQFLKKKMKKTNLHLIWGTQVHKLNQMMKLLNLLVFHLVINFLLSREDFLGLKGLPRLCRQSPVCSKNWFSKDICWSIFKMSDSCQTLNHIFYNLCNNFVIILKKEISNKLLKNLFYASQCGKFWSWNWCEYNKPFHSKERHCLKVLLQLQKLSWWRSSAQWTSIVKLLVTSCWYEASVWPELYEASVNDNVKFRRNIKMETLFQQNKTFTTKDFTLTLPITNHPFFHCFFFNNWHGLCPIPKQ